MNVKITGYSGFVGCNLIKYLKPYSINIGYISRGELTSNIDRNILSCDAIIHLAGKAHDLKKTSNPDDYYQVNYQITKNLYDAFIESDANKFIFISTVKAVSDHLNECLTEDIIPSPQTHYGKSKLMAEEYIQSKHLPPGKSYYILRPCMIHGPGNKGNLNLLYNFVSKGLPYPLAAFENNRSFLSVDNLCFIIKEIIEREDILGGIYNVADDGPLSTTEVVSLISQLSNKTPRLLSIPKKVIVFLATIGDTFKLPLNTERLGKLTENYIISNQKIKNALKKQLPLTSKEGIVKTINSFKTNIKLK
ncbi:NAD-dependent epimerase/dehydratase family protein [Mucilaginibacter paludis]|uniref:NAD-dependent epimerase/dehydratase n=1 Tax=Mucilaginibacter paludis DSM 18603 TaxID=714943 RepID=H1YJ25_9SPHI|nr:NAD-dependent epimerase/dehydratase family protein [Mucilaginibacter paludis]EHQ27720.1 NAD-dependent epimerase/dehydratase [Mucilaginibacter paludis DSM 18603]